MRAKQNFVQVSEPRHNDYVEQPIRVIGGFRLIEDPLNYEMEYKKRNVWSVHDIKIYLQILFEYPKQFDKIARRLPHKSSKEIIFFYHTFKKLLRLKNTFKNCQHHFMSI